MVEDVIKDVLKAFSENLALSLDKVEDGEKVFAFVKDYFQIYYGKFEVPNNENPILSTADALDAIEWEKKYVKNPAQDYFAQLFSDDENPSRNQPIRKLANEFGIWNEAFQLTKGSMSEGMKDIAYIANGLAQTEQKKYKVTDYFAIVQMDGDNMGAVLKSFQDDIKESQAFSKCCHTFARESADFIHAYGEKKYGMTVYAGGDDLLFLVPILTNESNVFRLVEGIKAKFECIFAKYINNPDIKEAPSLSAGIFISHQKFPLYEAFRQARMLLAEAKRMEGKNATAIHIQKHSGRVFSMMARETTKNNEPFKAFCDLIPIGKELFDADFLHAVHYKIQTYASLFEAIPNMNPSNIDSFFTNIFDHEIHDKEQNQKFIQEVKACFLKIIEDSSRIKVMASDKEGSNAIQVLGNILSMMKFFYETGYEERRM